MVMARMPTGFAVIGDTQQLPGYCVLLYEDAMIDHLTDLPRPRRAEFLLDLALLGEAVETACRPNGLRRINYEVLGNSMSVLHGHVHARYDWEPADKVGGPVWRYPNQERYSDAHVYDERRHGELRAQITAELQRIMREANRTAR